MRGFLRLGCGTMAGFIPLPNGCFGFYTIQPIPSRDYEVLVMLATLVGQLRACTNRSGPDRPINRPLEGRHITSRNSWLSNACQSTFVPRPFLIGTAGMYRSSYLIPLFGTWLRTLFVIPRGTAWLSLPRPEHMYRSSHYTDRAWDYRYMFIVCSVLVHQFRGAHQSVGGASPISVLHWTEGGFTDSWCKTGDRSKIGKPRSFDHWPTSTGRKGGVETSEVDPKIDVIQRFESFGCISRVIISGGET